MFKALTLLYFPYWFLFLFAIFVASASDGGDSVNLPSGGTISYSAMGGKTRLEIRTVKGARYVLSVKRDPTVSSEIAPSKLEVVGEIKGAVIIFIDTYPSIPHGMSYCQAGEERFLRVISITGKQAVETFRVKLESCLGNKELASHGIDWHPESSMLSIHWLQGPDKMQKPDELAIRIGADGNPE